MPSTASCPISPPARRSAEVKGSVRRLRQLRETKVGWTVGGGLEYAFVDNWTAKLEYLYRRSRRGALPTRPARAAIRSTSRSRPASCAAA
jgi:opacity protein-like surface antigen